MPQQVVSIQNDETAVNVIHSYKDVFTLEIGEHAKLRMKRDSLLQSLTTLRLFTDIIDSDNGTRIYIHDDARAGEANYIGKTLQRAVPPAACSFIALYYVVLLIT